MIFISRSLKSWKKRLLTDWNLFQREKNTKMNKVAILSILTGMLVGGCGEGYYWYKKGATLQQAETACKECYIEAVSDRMVALHDAKREAQLTKMPYIPETEETFGYQLESNNFYNCMKSKGYREVSGDFLDPSLRKKSCSPIPSRNFPIAGE